MLNWWYDAALFLLALITVFENLENLQNCLILKIMMRLFQFDNFFFDKEINSNFFRIKHRLLHICSCKMRLYNRFSNTVRLSHFGSREFFTVALLVTLLSTADKGARMCQDSFFSSISGHQYRWFSRQIGVSSGTHERVNILFQRNSATNFDF